MVLKFKAIVKGAPEFKEGMGEGVVLEQEVVLDDSYSDVQVALCIGNIKENILRDTFEVTVEEVK
jgi:hypothetical protein